MHALISGARVVDLAEAPFPVHPSMVWVLTVPTVQVGHLYDADTGTFAAAPPPPSEPEDTAP